MYFFRQLGDDISEVPFLRCISSPPDMDSFFNMEPFSFYL